MDRHTSCSVFGEVICGRVIQRGFIRLYCNLTYKMDMNEDKAIP